MRLTSIWSLAVAGLVLAGCADDSGSTATTPASGTRAPATSSPETAEDNGVRPPVGESSYAPSMAFDADARVMVAVVGGETWLFDVTIDQWSKAEAVPSGEDAVTHADGRWMGHRLVYSAELGDVVDVTFEGIVSSYDVATDEWTVLSDGQHTAGHGSLVGIDGGTGGLVVIDFATASQAWRMDLVERTWTPIDTELPATMSAGIMTYDPAAGGFVVIEYGDDETKDEPTYLFQAGTGTWTRLPDLPTIGFGFGPTGSEGTFATETERTVFISLGAVAEYDSATGTWTVFVNGQPTTDTMSLLAMPRTGGSAVADDPVNGRLLMYGGELWMGNGEWTSVDAMWAYAPMTHEWSTVQVPSTV